MKILNTVAGLREWRQGACAGSLGFVPTMGALHDGHLRLIEQSCAENADTLVSIFVNRAQFNDPADCDSYPAPLERDLDLCRQAGVSAVFLPGNEDLYPDGYTYRVDETQLSRILEGAHRPGHFTGVLTVVLKLLLLANAHKAYFGEKDWQQLQLVRGMVAAFFLETEIVPVATVREPDGLAMSSRNIRLSPAARKLAPEFHRVLSAAPDCSLAVQELESLGFGVEYVEELNGRRLGAVQLDGVRLIDNIRLGV